MQTLLRVLTILGIIGGVIAAWLAYRRRLDQADEEAMSEHVRRAIEETRRWREEHVGR